MSLLAALLVLTGGALIGAVSIGGVLVVPALTEAAGVPLERAIAASMAGFLATGLVVIATQRKAEGGPAIAAWPLGLAALAGAIAGAALLDLIPGAAIRLLIAAIAIVSGVHALLPAKPDREPRALPAAALVAIGAVVGCGSALSGTGGPVLLLPILLLLGVPLRSGIRAAQAVQLPIALSATGVNAVQGRLDLPLAAATAGLLIAGALLGGWLATRLDTSALKRITACGLIALGLWYVYAAFVR